MMTSWTMSYCYRCHCCSRLTNVSYAFCPTSSCVFYLSYFSTFCCSSYAISFPFGPLDGIFVFQLKHFASIFAVWYRAMDFDCFFHVSALKVNETKFDLDWHLFYWSFSFSCLFSNLTSKFPSKIKTDHCFI